MASRMELDPVSSERLGRRLRELRARSGKSLRAVARELGISASAVSQMERGLMRPSVSRLIAYVSAIGAPLAAVFDMPDGEEPGTPVPDAGGGHVSPASFAIRRSWEAAPIRLSGGVTFRRLSPTPTPGVEFFESSYPPNAVSTAHGQFHQHDGYEVGTVTAGELTIEFESESVTLAGGDSITFACSRLHLIRNRSATVTAIATWLIVNR